METWSQLGDIVSTIGYESRYFTGLFGRNRKWPEELSHPVEAVIVVRRSLSIGFTHPEGG